MDPTTRQGHRGTGVPTPLRTGAGGVCAGVTLRGASTRGALSVTSTNDTAIVIPILVGAFALASLFAWLLVKAVRAFLASSLPYRDAVRQAQSEPKVIEALGAPIQAGPPRGSLRYDLFLGNRAALRIPLSGPIASGRLTVRAVGRRKNWRYTRIQLKVDGRKETVEISGWTMGV